MVHGLALSSCRRSSRFCSRCRTITTEQRGFRQGCFWANTGAGRRTEYKVHEEAEAEKHGEDDQISTHTPVSRNFLKSCRADLERFSCGVNLVSFNLHIVKLVLILKHAIEVASHFVRNRIERLLNFVSRSGLALFDVHVGSGEVWGAVKGGL